MPITTCWNVFVLMMFMFAHDGIQRFKNIQYAYETIETLYCVLCPLLGIIMLTFTLCCIQSVLTMEYKNKKQRVADTRYCYSDVFIQINLKARSQIKKQC